MPAPVSARDAPPPRPVAAATPAAAAADDDADLIRRSQSGDRIAFEQLVRRTARLVFSRLYLETGDTHRAEDLVQETFLIAWRSIHQVTDPAGFRPWLLSIARSALLDAARRESRKKRGGAGLNAAGGGTDPPPTSKRVDYAQAARHLHSPEPGPAEAAERAEARRRVLEVLKQLPEEYSLPLTLRYIAGADYDTIGRQLGLSNGSLRGLLNRGMAKLRQMMGKP